MMQTFFKGTKSNTIVTILSQIEVVENKVENGQLVNDQQVHSW
jgi:hypothetical protein